MLFKHVGLRAMPSWRQRSTKRRVVEGPAMMREAISPVKLPMLTARLATTQRPVLRTSEDGLHVAAPASAGQ